jgi:hypothetical protein
LRVLGPLPADPLVREADRQGAAVYDLAPDLAAGAQSLATALEQLRVPQ